MELEKATANLQSESITKDMKLLQSPSQTANPQENLVSKLYQDASGNAMNIPQLEKEIKRLKNRNERIIGLGPSKFFVGEV